MLNEYKASLGLQGSIRNMFKAMQKENQGKEHVSSTKEKDVSNVVSLAFGIMEQVKNHYHSDNQELKIADIDVSVLRPLMDEAIKYPKALRLDGDERSAFKNKHSSRIIDATKISEPKPIQQAQRPGDVTQPSSLLPESATLSQKASIHGTVGRSLTRCYWQRHSGTADEPGLRQRNESKAKIGRVGGVVGLLAIASPMTLLFTPYIISDIAKASEKAILKPLEHKAERPLKAALYYHHKSYPELLTEERLEQLKEEEGLFNKVTSSDIMALVNDAYDNVHDAVQRSCEDRKVIMLGDGGKKLPEAAKEAMATVAKGKGELPFTDIAEFLGLEYGLSVNTAGGKAIAASQLEQQIINGNPNALPPGEKDHASWRKKILAEQQEHNAESAIPGVG